MEHNETNFWADLDELRFRMDCANQIVYLLSSAVECGNSASEEYKKAVLGVYDYLSILNCDMEQIIETMRSAVSNSKVCNFGTDKEVKK